MPFPGCSNKDYMGIDGSRGGDLFIFATKTNEKPIADHDDDQEDDDSALRWLFGLQISTALAFLIWRGTIICS